MLDFNGYQKNAMRTSPEDHDRALNGALGLIGECGELIDLWKKYLFQCGDNPPMPVDKMKSEAGDLLWYLAELASGLGYTLHHMLYMRIGYSGNEKADIEATLVSMMGDAVSVYRYYRDGSKAEAGAFASFIYKQLIDILAVIGTDLEEVARLNIEKLKKRYPDGFDPMRSMYRPEYVNNEK